MAQILYMLVSKVNPDPYIDAMNYKKDDVVSVREDDDAPYEKDPGIAERLGSMWAVLRVPGRAEDYSALTAPEVGDPKVNRRLQRRAFKLDVDTLSKQQVMSVDGKSVDSVFEVSLQSAVIDAKSLKASLADPDVLEPDVVAGEIK